MARMTAILISRSARPKLLRINQELFDLLPKLQSRYIVSLVTDVPALHAEINRAKGLYVPFNPCILSREVGLVKPQPEIYELALQELKLPAVECAFIDDKPANIEAANKFGFQTILFENNQQLLKALK